jgi:hypothetical protein
MKSSREADLDFAQGNFDVVVPTRDGISHVMALSGEYRRLGLRPRYFIDSRSRDSYKAIAAHVLGNVSIIDTDGECVEQIMPRIVEKCIGRWIIRLDDDEAPSSSLASWLANGAMRGNVSVIAFPRRTLRLDGTQVQYARTIPGIVKHDYQYRCFVLSRVKIDSGVHTPGIRFSESEVMYAPHDCCIYHFDWIVRSPQQRKAKLVRYEKLQGGAGEVFKYQYLPEDFDSGLYDFAVVDDPVISRLALRLRAAREFYETATEKALSRLRGVNVYQGQTFSQLIVGA